MMRGDGSSASLALEVPGGRLDGTNPQLERQAWSLRERRIIHERRASG